MRLAVMPLALAVLLVSGACNRDPKVVSKRYVDSGVKYFEKQKYKEASLMFRQAIAKDRKNGEAYYRLALTELKLGQPTAAYRSLLRAVELQPENVDAKVKLADLCLLGYMADRQRRPKQLLDEARKQAAEILKADPKSFAGLRLQGYLALTDGNAAEALKFFEQANASKPFQQDVVLTLVQLLAARDRFSEAEKLAKDMIAHDKAYGQIYDILYLEYMKRKRTADAEAVLKTKIENNPRNVRCRIQLAGHYAALQRPQDMEAALSEVVSRPQDFPLGLREVGDFYFRLNQLDQALKYYEQGISADKAHKADYQKRMVEILVQQGKRAEASQLVEAVLKENPKDSEAVAMRAALSLEGGSRDQIERAIADLQSVLTSSPNNPVVRFNLGRAYLAKGDLEQARLQFQDAIKKRPDYIPARLSLGSLLLLKGDFSGALNLANETLQIAPANLTARLIRTSALSALGDGARTRQELTEITRLYPRSRDAQFQLGLLNFQEKKYKEAEQIFARLRESAPLDPRGAILLAETYLAQGKNAAALELLQKEVEKNPNRDELRLNLANVALRTANYDLATRELSTLIQRNPKNASLYVQLGATYRAAGDYKTALEQFKKARDIAPDNATANLEYALMLEATGQSAAARPIYEQVVKIQPDNAVALNNLAFMMAENGENLDQALTLAQRAKQRLPNDANVADTLGWIYIKKNLSDNAIQIFRELVQKNPTHVTWRYHLAMALYQKGDRLGARRELETCLRNKPTREEEAKIRELLGKVS